MTGKKATWTKLPSCAAAVAAAVVVGQGCGGAVGTLDGAGAGTGGTSADQGPIPDQFEATLVTGTLCMPSQIQTGRPGDTVSPQYPVRFTTCLYRCVTLSPDASTKMDSIWDCNSDCRVILVPIEHFVRVAGEQGCDASQFVSPPPAECTNQTLDWMIPTPGRGTGSSRTYPTGPFRVTVPFLTLAQSQQYAARTNAGEVAGDVLDQLVGTQSYPTREFFVNFDPSYPAVTSADQLGAGDCHALPAP
jgi:hypothetical protein